jgi:hypothetical protein
MKTIEAIEALKRYKNWCNQVVGAPMPYSAKTFNKALTHAIECMKREVEREKDDKS